jgi:peptidoglycan/LPS O-acetylase OafA/YrhL
MSPAFDRGTDQPPTAQPAILGYTPALDGVRALAIGLVVAFNAGMPPFWSGFTGVWVFFVLSGFLITRIVLEGVAREGAASLGPFYLRRFERLFPPLLAMLITYAAFQFAHDGLAAWEPVVYDAIFAASYASNWTYVYLGAPNALGHTWSLAVEEQFYALWPLLVLAGWHLGRARGVALVLGVLLAALAAWRGPLVAGSVSDALTWPWARIYCGTDVGATGFLAGGALALFVASGRGRAWLESASARRLAPWMIALATVAVAVLARVLPLEERFTYLYGLPLVELASVVLLAGLLVPAPSLPRRLFEWAPAVFVGRLSYSLYLWHLPVLMHLKTIDRDWRFVAAIGLPLSFACALASWYLIERRLVARSARRGLA